MDEKSFVTHSLHDPRILRIISAALKAVDPAEAVRRHCPPLTGTLHGLGIGKASIPMLTALVELYPLSSALAISKHASRASSADYYPPLSATSGLFPVILGNHPIPDSDSLYAGERVLEFVSSLSEDDTLVCLISGGGSALVTVPYAGITLADLRHLTARFLACGATINEINTLRRALDRIKGGGILRATKAKVISLILSDVIGNPLETIASGPTYPSPTTNADALAVLRKYRLEGQVSRAVLQILVSDDLSANNRQIAVGLQNLVIGDNKRAAQAALEQAKREGFHAEVLTNELQGEAREVGRELAQRLRVTSLKGKRPFCMIAGGETTVIIRGNGKGGRNQELALAAVNELDGLENVLLITLATDGEDGPTDAAGAVVTGATRQRGERLGLDAAGYLSRNDAYAYFDVLGDLIRCGPSGTNVNDLVFLVAT